MSFFLTKKQFVARDKTVTRRDGWLKAKVGDIVWGVEKCQGLKRGEKAVRLGLIQFTDVRREPLSAITQEDCVKEGFPEMTPDQFVAFYCKHNKKEPTDEVTRIEFKHLETNVPTQLDLALPNSGDLP